MGFEPTPAQKYRLAVQRLNHSAILHRCKTHLHCAINARLQLIKDVDVFGLIFAFYNKAFKVWYVYITLTSYIWRLSKMSQHTSFQFGPSFNLHFIRDFYDQFEILGDDITIWWRHFRKKRCLLGHSSSTDNHHCVISFPIFNPVPSLFCTITHCMVFKYTENCVKHG